MSVIARKSFIWICAIALCALPLSADGPETGMIDGVVTDAQGGALPGVSVTLSGPQDTKNAITDAQGKYRFGLLQAGYYTVTATLEGLGTAEFGTQLSPGARKEVDLALQAATSETITVTSEAPLISKYETGSTSTISAEVAADVTYGSRLYISSLTQLPGVVIRQNATAMVSMNGGISSETGAFIEGVDTSMSRRGGEPRMLIPGTAITETTVESAGFGAEYGRATGGIINSVIKTGTNTFHGDFLYIGQNPKWRAENVFELERPDDQINSFETSIGGPIYKDKAWFFASYSEINSNSLDRTRTGVVFDTTRTAEPLIGKVNLVPADRHQIAITAIDTPSDALNATAANPGDEFAMAQIPLNGRLQTGSWSFAATNSVFTELKLTNREELVIRGQFRTHEIDPNASPDSPNGNNERYHDGSNNLRFNGIAVPLGPGYNDFPREAAQASVTIFKGNHELKFGGDYQQVEFSNSTDVPFWFRGNGFCRECPGGFLRPIFKRVNEQAPPVGAFSDMASAFAQDRLEVGDHLTFQLGLRLDDQSLENNSRDEISSYTEVVPRFSVVYDVNSDGKLLVRGTAGRYYHLITLGVVHQSFTSDNTGVNTYDQFGFNPATGLYDRFQRHVEPGDSPGGDIVPYYKDEVSAGVDWQFSNLWVLKTRAVVSEADNIFYETEQFDAAGAVGDDIRNWPDAGREYQAISFELNRAFRNGWTLRTNYTFGNTEGNVRNRNDIDTFNEGLGGIETGSPAGRCGGGTTACGATDATSNSNYFGKLQEHRDAIVNVVGLKRLTFGKQDIVLGGFFRWHSGTPWGFRPTTGVRHPVSGQVITTSTQVEPIDANTLEEIMTLNVNAMWEFPLAGKFRGQLGFEVANVTDEQEQTRVNSANGRPQPTLSAYQTPREFRLKVGFQF